MEEFRKQERGAKILLKEVQDAERFGVAEIQGDHIVGIEEKPAKPEIELCGDRDLHVRRNGIRKDAAVEALGARRVGNHGCK